MSKRKPKPKQRQRRRHSEEFKREAAKLVHDEHVSVAEAARNLGIHPNLLRNWKQRIEAEEEDKTSRRMNAWKLLGCVPKTVGFVWSVTY